MFSRRFTFLPTLGSETGITFVLMSLLINRYRSSSWWYSSTCYICTRTVTLRRF
jgi:hypothetical protein